MKKHLLILFSISILGISTAQNNCQEIIPLIGSESTSHTESTNTTTGVTTYEYSLCQGESITLNAVGNYPENNTNYTQLDQTSSFYWVDENNNTITGQNFNQIFSDYGTYNYTLNIEDVENCDADNPLNIRINVIASPIPTYTSSNTTITEFNTYAQGYITYHKLCQGETISFSGNATYPTDDGLNSTSTFTWTSDDFPTQNSPNSSYLMPNSGGYEFSLSVEDENGCISTDPKKVLVAVSTEPTINLNVNPSTICPGVTTSIGATGDLTFSSEIVNEEWNTGYTNTFADKLFIPDGPFCPPGVYETNIEFNSFLPNQTLTDLNDFTRICIEMEHTFVGDLTINLTSPDGSTVILLADENDSDAGNGLSSNALGEPNEEDEVEISICDPTSNPAGNGYIYCWSPNPTIPSTWHELNNSINLDDPISASVVATNTNIYKAYNNSFNEILNTPLNGDWTINITDSYGMDNGWIFQWWIDFNPRILPSSWSFNNKIDEQYFLPEPSIVSNNESSIIIKPDPGIHNYTYQVVDNFGCTYREEITITSPPYVVAYFNQNEDTVIYNNGMVQFTNFSSPDPQTNLVYNQWSFGDGQFSTEEHPEHDFNQIGTYSVQLTVTDEIGCTDSFSSKVVATEDYLIWTPTAFTPNGDGKNDNYKPILHNIIESSFELFIYDRWGKLVYQSNEIDSGWDGIRQDNGISAEVGNYSFLARFNSKQNIQQEKTGSFVLLK